METKYSDRLTKVNVRQLGKPAIIIESLGKIIVLKSSVASNLVYILSPLPTNYRVLID